MDEKVTRRVGYFILATMLCGVAAIFTWNVMAGWLSLGLFFLFCAIVTVIDAARKL